MSQYIKEAKEEYVGNLVKFFYPLAVKVFQNIWGKAVEKNSSATRVAAFQYGLRMIKDWDEDRVDKLHQKVVGDHAIRFDNLVREVLKCSTKMMCMASNVDPTYVKLVIPQSRRFIHKVFVAVAFHLYAEPNALDSHKFDEQEISKHLHTFVRAAVLDVVQEDTPFDEIMKVADEARIQSHSAAASASPSRASSSSVSSEQQEEENEDEEDEDEEESEKEYQQIEDNEKYPKVEDDSDVEYQQIEDNEERQQDRGDDDNLLKEENDDDVESSRQQDKEKKDESSEKQQEPGKDAEEASVAILPATQPIQEEKVEVKLKRSPALKRPRKPSPSFTEVISAPSAYDAFKLDHHHDEGKNENGDSRNVYHNIRTRRRG